MIWWLAVIAITNAAIAVESQEAEVPECAVPVTADRDRDGLSNACESALAYAFSPLLTVRTGGCNWDFAANRPGGGYFYAVQPQDSVVRVAYLPAYFRDCGWKGLKCWLPWVDCAPHNGDSEIIVLELRAGDRNDGWSLTGVFLSAHCFGRTSSSCRWYRGTELKEFDRVGAAPVVRVAEGRNANYPSRRACDKGHHSLDTCERHDLRYHFPIDPAWNLGSRAVPIGRDGCVSASALPSDAVDPSAVECFWRADAPFRGWQNAEVGVTPYERYLREIAGF